MFVLGIAFIILLTAADQLCKFLVVNNIPLGEYITVIPKFLEITYTKNTGSAFGMFSQYTWLLAIVSLIALIIFGYLYRYVNFKKRALFSLALILIIAGTLGNMIDRIFRGEVVDMITFIFGNWHFWTFNFADSYLTIGVVLMLVDLMIGKNDIWKK